MDDAPGDVASRTCTAVDEREPQRDGGRQAPLTDYADTAAYVLIAEPGVGKTTAFETEAAKQGGVCVTVRNFLRFDKPEWRHGGPVVPCGEGRGQGDNDELFGKLLTLDLDRF